MSRKLTTEDFKSRSRGIHGDKYDYSLVKYEHSKIKIKIICSKHGIFEQIPNTHLRGIGCSKCGINKVTEQNRLTNEDFAERAHRVHGNKYDYSLVTYTNAYSKVKIICSEHGVFEQQPRVHLSNKGCPRCAKTRFNLSEPGVLYVLTDDKQYPNLLKVGVTNNFKQRLRYLQGETPHPVIKLAAYSFSSGVDAYKLEQEIHQNFHDFNAGLTGFDGATEWFNYHPQILDYIVKQV